MGWGGGGRGGGAAERQVFRLKYFDAELFPKRYMAGTVIPGEEGAKKETVIPNATLSAPE